MKKTWKDPDTSVVHAIDREEGKEARPTALESAILHVMSIDEITKSFFRRVTMSCGKCVLLDSDEFIMPHGEAMLQSPPPILRPWITGREAPTCVVCASAQPLEPMRNDWGTKPRGPLASLRDKHRRSVMMKAYIVRHTVADPAFRENVVVYHYTEDAAKELGRHCLTQTNSWEETEAERAPEHDVRCVGMIEPEQEEDGAYLREKGWRYEDEKTCASCGLAAFGQEKYAVCNECHQCKECGCDTTCDELDGPSTTAREDP